MASGGPRGDLRQQQDIRITRVNGTRLTVCAEAEIWCCIPAVTFTFSHLRLGGGVCCVCVGGEIVEEWEERLRLVGKVASRLRGTCSIPPHQQKEKEIEKECLKSLQMLE